MAVYINVKKGKFAVGDKVNISVTQGKKILAKLSDAKVREVAELLGGAPNMEQLKIN